ncbi:ABC transporter permease [Hymenobacter ginsengisoli]|uniref:ABC transporter permease n=1 Tax=Hymenobacter ginsengisoli TaxID=1051626 RepID=A0ABP8Q3C1_9BACT|nr:MULTISPECIES: ABC transporter permease [unclassified Hymenobacter]MBO2032571.1 ABC transporter permease [Hymenobacter sp. BT559]
MASKFLLVAQREYLTRVRKRAFVVLTLLVPLLIVGFGLFVGKLAESDETTEIVDVRDDSGLGIASQLVSTPQLRFQAVSGTLAEAKQSFQKQKHAGLLYLPAGLSENDPQGVQFFGKGNISLNKENRVEKALTDAFAELKMRKSGLTQTQLDQLRAKVPLNSVSVDETGKEKDSNSGVTTGIASALAILIYFFIFLYGVQIMRGVGEEKSSRIMEVMLSSVKPFDLMMGKIVGVAAVGLTQFLLWGLLSWGATSFVVPLVMGNDQSAKTEVAATPAASPALGSTAATSSSPIADKAAASAEQMNPAKRAGVIGDAFDKLHKLNIPIGTIVFGFIVYFLGGYLLYSALFGAVGAAVDDQTDTQQFMFPITMPLILSYIVGFSVILRNPDGPVAFWMSMIPFTSPVAMVIRLPFGVPAWQLALSIALLVVGFVGTVWVAARIYRVGILMYGKKVTYKELSKWMFYKG